MSRMETPVLILASRSPRRIDLLHSLGIPFEVHPANVSEGTASRGSPRDVSIRLAEAKARAVAEQYPERLTLGADTIVSLEGRILGKPEDAEEARRTLEALSGKWHAVWTGICLVHRSRGWEFSDAVVSKVRFRELSREEIDAYVSTGEPLDKAGAYGIQGRAAGFVAKLEGSLNNVIGLPTERLLEILREHFPGLPGGGKTASPPAY
jgi:septum formation protein